MHARLGVDCGEEVIPLPWDSTYFGFPVARLSQAELDDDALEKALQRALAQSIQLVYWATSPGRPVAPELLRTFGGARVDQKTVFARELGTEGRMTPASRAATVEVVEYPQAPASERLLELAVNAGRYSRFKVDPHITEEQFRGLYEIWMRRSTLRELAGTVLVAVPREEPEEVIGAITLSESEGVGHIGLIAVLDNRQGQGVGGRLMRAGHDWMQRTGTARAEVVTQLTNQGACRLYQSCGYRLREVVDFYHFWPLAACGSEVVCREEQRRTCNPSI